MREERSSLRSALTARQRARTIGTAEQKIADLKAQIDAHRELSTSLAFD
jgi:hypothetical protein